MPCSSTVGGLRCPQPDGETIPAELVREEVLFSPQSPLQCLVTRPLALAFFLGGDLFPVYFSVT